MSTNTNSTPGQSPSDEIELREPPLYSVSLLNDDFTTQEFVVQILTSYFNKTDSEAFDIMLSVHSQGKGLAGIYSHDVAETKVYLVHQAAKENQFPLKCVMEPVDEP